MTSDLEIYHAAQALIEQHGEDAPVHAAVQADELAAAGDMKGCVTWKRVVRAVKELLDTEPPNEDKAVH